MAALDRRAPAAGAPGHRGRRRRVPAGAPRDRRRAGDDSHCLRCHLSAAPVTALAADPAQHVTAQAVRGRIEKSGEVAGVGWAQAEAAAARAADSGNLQGFRDAAIILVMSDTLARIGEVVALQCSDVEPETTTSGGTVHIRASKTDQLGADGIRGIVRKRVAAVPGSGGRVGGHSFRVGSARGRAAAGRAGGARLIRRRSTFASRPPAVRSRAAPLPGGPVATLSTGQVYLRSAAAKCQPAGTARPYLDEQAYSLLRMTGEQTGTYVQATR